MNRDRTVMQVNHCGKPAVNIKPRRLEYLIRRAWILQFEGASLRG
ncbi:MAG: hypothetical protein AAYR33_02995 [Acetobacteraceae bacterium]